MEEKIKQFKQNFPDFADELSEIQSLKAERKFEKIGVFPFELAKELTPLILSGLNEDETIRLLETIYENRNISSSPNIRPLLNFFLTDIEKKQIDELAERKLFYKKILNFLIVIMYYQKDNDGISHCYNLFTEINEGHINLEAVNVYMYQGLAMYFKRYYYEAIRYYDVALDFAEKLGDEAFKGRIYDCMGRAYGDKGRYKEAFEYYNLSIESKEKIGDINGLAISYGNKGRLHSNIGQFDEALECFQKDLEISMISNDVIGQIIMHSQIGAMFLKKNDFDKAIEGYQKSLELAEQNKNQIGIGFALAGLGECYLESKQSELFADALNRMYQAFFNKTGFEGIKGLYYKLKGEYFVLRKEYDKAFMQYSQSLNISEKNMSIIDKGLMEEKLALLFEHKNEPEKLKAHLMKSIKYFENSNAFYHLKRVQNKLKDVDLKDWLIYVFRGFVGKDVIQYVVSDEPVSEHVGSKRFSTVLFSDIRGFTTFSENLLPEDLIDTLNDYLSGMTDVIEKNDGEIDKYIGDAIMAVFNPPEAKENAEIKDEVSAINAVRASSQMVEELFMFNKILRDRRKKPINCGIGVHSGEVISGTMGSSSRKNYTVIGDVVNTSSRIEGLTKKYGCNILISEDTHNLCKNASDFHFRMIDKVQVKGKNLPIIIYELYKIGTLPEIDSELLKKHNDAINEYFAGNFSGALKIFVQLYESFTKKNNTKLYEIYLNRCTSYIMSPPSKDWDGVFIMTEK